MDLSPSVAALFSLGCPPCPPKRRPGPHFSRMLSHFSATKFLASAPGLIVASDLPKFLPRGSAEPL